MAMTIEQYLAGKVDYNLTEENIQSILFDRGIPAGTTLENTTLKQRELCLADLYMFLATSSTTTSGEYESDGGWQHQKSAKNVVNRAGLQKMAQALYDKWNDEKSSPSGKIVMSNLTFC